METDCRRENAPRLPVLKSFTLPRVNHLISLPVSASVLTLLPAAPAAAPPCSNRLLRRNRFGDDSARSQGFCSGAGRFSASPACGRKQETLPALLQKPGMEKGEQGITGSSMPPRSLSPKQPALSRPSGAQPWGGSPDFSESPPRRDEHAVLVPAGWVSWNTSPRRA